MSLAIVDKNNKKVKDAAVTIDAGAELNKSALYFAVKAARNNLRHGTAKVKDRSEINRTNKKPFRQKGTGNARHGAKKSNIFVGGASAFGPRPRSYNEKMNKKFKAVSYREAFKYLIQNDSLKIVDQLNFDQPKTKEAAQVLKNLNVTKAVVVVPQDNSNAQLAFRNIKDVKVLKDNNLNLFDMLKYDTVVMTADVFESVKERYSL